MTPENHAKSLWPASAERRATLEAKLQDLITTIHPANDFYRAKLDGAGVVGRPFTLEQFCTRVPFTTREEWVADQERTPPYGTNLTYPMTDYTRFSRTSGSTGIPKMWLDTQDTWQAMLQNWKRVYASAGVSAESRIFFAFSFGPFLGFWTAFDAATQLGCLCVPGGGLSTSARLAIMLDTGTDTLCCTPTYAIHLGQTAQAEGFTFSADAGGIPIKRIIVAGEHGGSLPATRALITTLFGGAEVLDHHGMTEVGPVTYQASDEPGRLVVMESSFFAEVLVPGQSTPTPPGEEGELVLTTLKRHGSPLLRYRTGDLVRATRDIVDDSHEPKLILEGGILGRVDDMLVIRGVNVFPSAVENIVRGMPNVQEYVVDIGESHAMIDMALRVEWAHTCPNPETACKELSQRLRNAFSLRIPVTAVRRGEIPHFKMKAQRWIRTPHKDTGPQA